MKININSYIPITEVEGPNKRFVIWTQGCSIRCNDCANKHMWESKLGKKYETSDLITLISKYKDKIDGITFLGGEPLDQIEPVIEISKEVQKLGLTVLVFTGYEFEKIKDNLQIKELIKYIDILIDGKFEKEKIDYSRPWVGSSNQNYHFFSNKYNESIIDEYKNKFEIRITKDNKITINGMGDFNKLRKCKVINNATK